MIDKVRVVRFKRFADHTFDLRGSPVLLAGPNNSGKTTLLHAVAAWNLALNRWFNERGRQGGKRRLGIVLDEFSALPLREMNLLWFNRHTARKTPSQKTPKAAPIYIQVVVSQGRNVESSLTIEFLYASEKLIYVRPVASPEEPTPIQDLPDFSKQIIVAHVPAFSGISTQEPQHSTGMQSQLIGQGRPGEIVRNLLLELEQKAPQEWRKLQLDIQRLFQCELIAPEFSSVRSYITCEYRPNSESHSRASRAPKLDIANAGSGFHQVLLLLAFFYARPSSVLLLDEPDAHLHFILQREIFDHLRVVAQDRNCKLLVATHAEVLLDSCDPEQIISFVGQDPKRLISPQQKKQLKDALRQLTALDFLSADHVRAVMYVEDESDYKILRAWAGILKHEAARFLSYPYVWPLGGKGNLSRAKQHFQSLRLAYPEIRGICILDRDDGGDGDFSMPDGMQKYTWKRYEIENYMLQPNLLRRYVRGNTEQGALAEIAVNRAFEENFPTDIDFLKDVQVLIDLKGSEFLIDVLSRADRRTDKRDLFMLAETMQPIEIHPDVKQMLDRIASIIPTLVPSENVNLASDDPEGTEADDSAITDLR